MHCPVLYLLLVAVALRSSSCSQGAFLGAAARGMLAAAPSGGAAQQPAVRMWLDTAFFTDGEMQILRDIVHNSSGAMVRCLLPAPLAPACAEHARPRHHT